MRKILLTITALVTCSILQATDVVTVSAVTIEQGGTADVNIVLTCAESTYKGFQLDLTTPTDITPTVNESSRLVFTRGTRISEADDFSISSSLISSDHARFICTSPTATPIAAGNDMLIRLSITADEETELGVCTGHITGIEFNTTDNVRTLFDDIEFTIIVVAEGEKRIEFDESNSILPTYTAGEKGNVSMTRTITAGNWSTIVLPFTLTKAKAEEVFGGDVQLAEFSGFEVDYGDDDENVVPLGISMNFTTYTMSARKGMTGGKPFLIKTSTNITKFTADEVTLFDAVTDVDKRDEFDTSGKFTGSLVKTKVPADGLFLNGNKFWYSTGKTDIKAFRGWFELGAVLDKATDFSVKMYVFIDDEETHVDGIASEQRATDDVYDIMGRKVSKPNHKGVYIVGGKKVLFK